MLVVDAFLSLLAWLPQDLYFALLSDADAELSMYDTNLLTIDASLAALISTNAFTTPVVYLIFNENFRVSFSPVFILLNLLALINSF